MKKTYSIIFLIALSLTTAFFGFAKPVLAQTSGYCKDTNGQTLFQYTDQLSCENNSGTWTGATSQDPGTPSSPNGNAVCYDKFGAPQPCTGTNAQGQGVNAGADDASNKAKCVSWVDGVNFTACVLNSINGIGYLVMKMVAFITGLAALLLNGVIYYTVVQMAQNFSYIAGPVNDTWTLIRDVANMGFIFMLLYASIKTIIGQENDARGLVVKMIIAAVLVNFSLFFTKVIIDIANLLALTFYTAIAPGATALVAAGQAPNLTSAGLSNGLVSAVQAQSLWNVGSSTSFTGNIGTYFLSTIVLLVIIFVFLAAAVLFVVRYVVLIFVMILSPLMFLASVFPGLETYRKQWWDALSSQAFFAPVFFILMWIALTLVNKLSGVLGNTTTTWAAALDTTSFSSTIVPVILKFVLVISFTLAVIIISKSFSAGAGKHITALTKWAQGAAFGSVGWVGRKTLGTAGVIASNNDRLVNAADKKTGAAGAAARLALFASRKAASGTFDLRNATIPTGVASDLVRGTIGRTEIGKKIGADRFDEIKSFEIGSRIAKVADLGEGDKKSQKQISQEKKEKFDKIEAEQSREARMAESRLAIKSGLEPADETDQINIAVAAAGGIATPAQTARLSALKPKVDAMEKALASMTDKEVETMVEGNKELLGSQSFANRISVQQLEALNKTEKLTEQEKNKLKETRFKSIYAAMAPGGAGAASVGSSIRRLGDKELEMFDAEHLADPGFAKELKSSQVESIMKSNKFTSGQKRALGDARKAPLLDALDMSRGTSYAPNPALVREFITKKLSAKDIVGLMETKVSTPFGDIPLLTHPDVLQALTPSILKKMALEMTAADIAILRTALEAPVGGSPAVKAWLATNEGKALFQ